jgi:Na+/H+ antiporter NhaC
VALVGLVAAELVPDFGPMRAAERRTRETGKVLRDGANPMMGRELTDLEPASSPFANIWLNFMAPVALVFGINVWTFMVSGSAALLDSLMAACLFLGSVMWVQRLDTMRGLMEAAVSGIKGVMPAVLILALAYCINTVSKDLGTAVFVVQSTQAWMSPAAVPAVAFTVSAFVSFATGTSWGTYAIMVPVALPLAAQFAGDPFAPLVLVSFGAVAGGGVFGDHCSPLSDTTVLSSLGSASDHIDHVRTQLPYALAVGVVSIVLYLVAGRMTV